MAYQYVPLPEGLLCLSAQSQEHAGDSRRGSYSRRAEKGRRYLTHHQEWYLLRYGKRNWISTARELQNDLQQATDVRNRVHEGCLKADVHHCGTQLAFTIDYHNWQVDL